MADTLKLKDIEEFINKWSCSSTNINKKSKTPEAIEIERYYDFYSGMTPYTEISFRVGLISNDKEKISPLWATINSLKHPFIKNVSIKDNGVKTVTITLFDKDFASCSKYGIRLGGTYDNDNFYSLDQLIKRSLRSYLDYDEFKNGELSKSEIYEKNSKGLSVKFNGDYDDYSKDKEYICYTVEDIYKEYINKNITVETCNKYVKELQDKKKNNEKLQSKYYTSSDLGENKTEKQDSLFYLKFVQNNAKIPVANLRLRFGYADFNQELENNNELKKYFFDKGAIVEGNKSRSNRWWDASLLKGQSWEVIPKTFINENNKIEENKNGKHTIDTEGELYTSETGSNVSEDTHLNSIDQTTLMSRNIDLMITGYNSRLTNTGIEYTITAIEAKDASLLSARFLQRYAEITAAPEEVLYNLMHIFNENKDGSVANSPAKILFMTDTEDEIFELLYGKNNVAKVDKSLVQKYENKLAEEDNISNKLNYMDTYNAILNGEEIQEDILKKITLSFGSEAALENYRQFSKNPPIYKSVATLMDEFCAACPPKLLENKDTSILDPQTNEEVKLTADAKNARPLKWFSAIDDKTKINYIVLYYRRELKPEKIRVYKWGPALPYNSCVKQINIQNKGEFALLSGISAFNTNTKTVINRINSKNISGESKATTTEESVKEFGSSGTYNLISTDEFTADSYNAALSNGVYEGTIDIMGDPFFLFNNFLQPCTYPIKLEVLMPKNETELKSKDSDTIKNLHNEYGGNIERGNQRYHETTGYYVIKEINHNISSSGFTTTLTVLSYPNIEKNIGIM